MKDSHIIGKKGEQAATQFLQKKGMHIINRNWRARHLEIDIICKDKNTLVFVEVKTRNKTGCTKPYETLTLKKRYHIIKAAQNYLSHNRLWHLPCRFDVICILTKGHCLELEYYPHVFKISEIMDYSYTSWQPW